jgi:hypothetical protein
MDIASSDCAFLEPQCRHSRTGRRALSGKINRLTSNYKEGRGVSSEAIPKSATLAIAPALSQTSTL